MTRTTCPYCGVGCGVRLQEGKIDGDPDHPANRGRLCSKGAALGETLNLDGRVGVPRIHGSDVLWHEALDLVAQRFGEAIETHGPDSVALYVSGQFLTEDYYVANKLMKGFVGTSNIDTNSRLCMASSVAGHVRAFGEDVVPACYDDIDEADLVVLVGSNTAWCHPVLFQRLVAAKQARSTKIVVIDPRRTATCEIADLHLAIAPGGDVALFASLLVALDNAGAIDRAYVEAHTDGLEHALNAARAIDVVAATQLQPADIDAFHDLFVQTNRVLTLYSQGVNQSSAGTDKVSAILNCHLATGRIGKPGSGPFSLTGQPNAMGGREVGGLANQLAAHLHFEPSDLDRLRRFWSAPNLATKPGLKAVDMFDAVLDGRIRAIWILGTNPLASMPRADRVRAALDACPFVVVSDVTDRSDTAKLAHVLLPAAGWGEKDGTVTNSERRISRQRALRAPDGDARPDWWQLAQVGQRLFGSFAFGWKNPAAIFREHAALSSFENDGRRAFDIGGLASLSDEAYDALEPVQWPVTRDGKTRQRFFADGGFYTPDRKARIVPTPWRAPVSVTSADFPLTLNTGRLRDQWHTMTRTGRVARLMNHTDEPFVALHPDDVARYGLTPDGLVRIESALGATVLRVREEAGQRPGDAFVPMHWTRWFTSGGAIDALVPGATDPVSGQPELKATAVRVAPVAIAWRALLLRRATDVLPGDGFYWTRVALESGEAFLLAGWDAMPAIDTLLGDGERIDYTSRDTVRAASLVDGKLDSCLFVTQSGNLPSRDVLAHLLDAPLDAETRFALLAGRTAVASQGRTVCACFSVGLNTILDAITSQGLVSAAEIGAALGAGTNCGSCIPELEALLREGTYERAA
ncbi:nitrate reductase [Roseiterribacter gracilis]|uniref:Nitrate reductase n=1 Tax=Roseiterribacter gracilis TaxID=2812848 RepID=A0A8S8XFB5_9PROT|nr:nitrate reductase [Rhodospirillales bacterium TMPK1]